MYNCSFLTGKMAKAMVSLPPGFTPFSSCCLTSFEMHGALYNCVKGQKEYNTRETFKMNQSA